MTATKTPRGRRLLGLGTKAFAVAAAAAALLSITATDASASQKPVHIGNTAVNVRDCYHPTRQPQPSQNCTSKGLVGAGTSVTLICQHEGQNIYGDVWWDYVLTPNNGYGYVADWYVNTGTSSYRVPGVDYCNY